MSASKAKLQNQENTRVDPAIREIEELLKKHRAESDTTATQRGRDYINLGRKLDLNPDHFRKALIKAGVSDDFASTVKRVMLDEPVCLDFLAGRIGTMADAVNQSAHLRPPTPRNGQSKANQTPASPQPEEAHRLIEQLVNKVEDLFECLGENNNWDDPRSEFCGLYQLTLSCVPHSQPHTPQIGKNGNVSKPGDVSGEFSKEEEHIDENGNVSKVSPESREITPAKPKRRYKARRIVRRFPIRSQLALQILEQQCGGTGLSPAGVASLLLESAVKFTAHPQAFGSSDSLTRTATALRPQVILEMEVTSALNNFLEDFRAQGGLENQAQAAEFLLEVVDQSPLLPVIEAMSAAAQGIPELRDLPNVVAQNQQSTASDLITHGELAAADPHADPYHPLA